MDINEIQDLIKFVSKAGVTEVEIERKDFKLTIKSNPEAKRRRGKAAAEEVVVTQPISMMQPMQQMPVAPMQAAPAPIAPPAAPAPAAPAKSESADENASYVTVKSPMIGTFYRSASPDKPPFVAVGDEVAPGKNICIIEAMKLFNEIEAEVSGRIVKVLVDDGTPVEYDQPLFLIDPS